MCLVEIVDLGRALRARRTAAGRTIASVAADAGLSVPYIANLENGRGNPTLTALNSLAAALGMRMTVDLAEGDEPAPEPPPALALFSQSARFTAEARWLAASTRVSETLARERLLHAMAGMASLTSRPLSDLDWHRVLDAAVLIARG